MLHKRLFSIKNEVLIPESITISLPNALKVYREKSIKFSTKGRKTSPDIQK